MEEKIYSWIYKNWPNKDTLNFIMCPMTIFVEQELTKSYLIETIAHNYMLMKTWIVPKEIACKILKTLVEFYEDNENLYDSTLWDIHESFEKKLKEKIWEDAWWFHVARSRNDQCTTDQKIFMKIEILKIVENLNNLCKVLINKTNKYNDVIMPGYTHLRIWTPSSFWFWLQSYLVQILECQNILQNNYEVVDSCPLWAGNSYWVNWQIDTNLTASNLGFSKTFLNALSAINSRWIHELHILSPLLNVMLILSRMMEDIIIWSSEEFNFLKIAEDYTTGSSIMPQKMNPDIAEKIRSKISTVAANFNQILFCLKWTPSWYNRDSSETKTAIINSLKEIKDSIEITAKMLESIIPNEEKMKLNIKPALATKLADFLVFKFNIPFRTAHKIVWFSLSKVSLDINNLNVSILNNSIKKFTQKNFKISTNNFNKIFDVKNSLKDYKYKGTPNPNFVSEVNEILLKSIKSNKKWWNYKNNNFYNSINNLLKEVKKHSHK